MNCHYHCQFATLRLETEYWKRILNDERSHTNELKQRLMRWCRLKTLTVASYFELFLSLSISFSHSSLIFFICVSTSPLWWTLIFWLNKSKITCVHLGYIVLPRTQHIGWCICLYFFSFFNYSSVRYPASISWLHLRFIDSRKIHFIIEKTRKMLFFFSVPSLSSFVFIFFSDLIFVFHVLACNASREIRRNKKRFL